jgi:hypothetical protein
VALVRAVSALWLVVSWGYLKDHVYHTNLHTVQEVQVKIEAVAEEITGCVLHDTDDNSVVHLYQVSKAEGPCTEHVLCEDHMHTNFP